jgi:hypothetical protein
MDNIDFKQFATCAVESAGTRAKRIIAFVYFRSKYSEGNSTLEDIKNDYNIAGLGTVSSTIIRQVLKDDRRVKSIGRDVWMIPSDRLAGIASELDLDRCAPTTSVATNVIAVPKASNSRIRDKRIPYVDARRIKELKGIKNANFDLSRLLAMCGELNDGAGRNNISTILLVRAILDHVPPIFGFKTFKEVANNFATTISIKASLKHLEDSSRTIADTHLHTPVRRKETLPTKTQVNFSQDLDVLLAEIVRIS